MEIIEYEFHSKAIFLLIDRGFIKGIDVSFTRAIIPQQDMAAIFSSLEVIVNLNKDFLKELSGLFRQWPEETILGDVFEKMVPIMKLCRTGSKQALIW